MSQSTFHVRLDNDLWLLQVGSGDAVLGRYITRGQALDAARRHAQLRLPSKICVFDPDGEYVELWGPDGVGATQDARHPNAKGT